MRELKVTVDNYDELNSATPWDYNSDKTLNAMLDLNNLLDEELGGHVDWGGRYAGWLDDFGIYSNSDEGWWSLAAIDPDNINLFIEINGNPDFDDLYDKCTLVHKRIKEIKALGSFKASTNKVQELLDQFND